MTGNLLRLLRAGFVPKGSLKIVGVNEYFFKMQNPTLPAFLDGFQDKAGNELITRRDSYWVSLRVEGNEFRKRYVVEVYDKTKKFGSSSLPEHLVARKTVDDLNEASRLYFSAQREMEAETDEQFAIH